MSGNNVNILAGRLKAVVDLSTDSTTVYTGAGRLIGLVCANDISAHDVLVNDNATLMAGVAASSPAGTSIDCFGMPFSTSLVVDPDNLATGTLTVIFEPDHDGQAGDGAN